MYEQCNFDGSRCFSFAVEYGDSLKGVEKGFLDLGTDQYQLDVEDLDEKVHNI